MNYKALITNFFPRVNEFVSQIKEKNNLNSTLLTKIGEFLNSWVNAHISNPALATDLVKLSNTITEHADLFSDQEEAKSVAKKINEVAESIFFPPELIQHILEFADPETIITMNGVCKWMKQLSFNSIIPAMNRGGFPIKDFGFSTIDKVIQFAQKHGQKIEWLDLSGFDDLTDEQLKTIITTCPKLRHLIIQNTKITNAGLAHLGELTSLKTLNLSGCYRITDAGFAHLGELTSLKELNLSWCKQITDTGLAHLKELTSLKTLNLERCYKITDAGLAHLSELTSLKTLNLSECDKITDAGLAHLKELTSLKELNLSWCYLITDSGLALLKKNAAKLKVIM